MLENVVALDPGVRVDDVDFHHQITILVETLVADRRPLVEPRAWFKAALVRARGAGSRDPRHTLVKAASAPGFKSPVTDESFHLRDRERLAVSLIELQGYFPLIEPIQFHFLYN